MHSSNCSFPDEKTATSAMEENGGGEEVDVENNAMTQTEEGVEMKMMHNSSSDNPICCLASANDEYEVSWQIYEYRLTHLFVKESVL